MARLIPASMPLSTVTDTSVQGGSRGRVNILTATAGTARWLAEYVTGAVATGNEPCAPYTAAGIGPGHDHSGGVLGRPLQHTIMACTFGGLAYAYTNTENAFAIRTSIDGSGTPQYSSLGSPRLLFNGMMKTILIPACGPGGTYFGADFVASVHCDDVASLLIEVTPEIGPKLSFTTALTATVNHCISGNSGRVPLVPGRRNNIHVKMELSYTAAVSIASLLSFGMHQIRNSV
jgi:hypothetical protein